MLTKALGNHGLNIRWGYLKEAVKKVLFSGGRGKGLSTKEKRTFLNVFLDL